MEEKVLNLKSRIIILIIFISIQILGLIFGIIHHHFGSDYSIYYTNTYNFWSNQNNYQQGFFYLNYFYFLCIWMFLLPGIVGLFVHIILIDFMFYYIMSSVKNDYRLYWFYANLALILIHAITFNTDIWIVFGFLLFLNYYEKWYSPFFLLLCFFKITPILTFGVLFLIMFYYRRKAMIKLLPSLMIVVCIITISFLTSTELIIKVLIFGENLIGETGIIVFFQPPHFSWWSIPLLVFLTYKSFKKRLIKKIWVVYGCITLFYGLIILIISSSVIYDYLLTNS